MNTTDEALTNAYAEGRDDESAEHAKSMQQVLELLWPVYEEVAGKERPYSRNSYLPPWHVEQLKKAIDIAKDATL